MQHFDTYWPSKREDFQLLN